MQIKLNKKNLKIIFIINIMNLLNTHIHELRFYIDKDAPEKYIKRWKEFKKKCENGENKHIVEQLKSYCKLENNKNLPYLKRVEGGLGGDDKQIRFKMCNSDNDIILHDIISTTDEKWNYDELDDLIYAFIKTANFNIKADCVNGNIKMFKIYNDD